MGSCGHSSISCRAISIDFRSADPSRAYLRNRWCFHTERRGILTSALTPLPRLPDFVLSAPLAVCQDCFPSSSHGSSVVLWGVSFKNNRWFCLASFSFCFPFLRLSHSLIFTVDRASFSPLLYGVVYSVT